VPVADHRPHNAEIVAATADEYVALNASPANVVARALLIATVARP
jgi:hypothetical protein